MSHVLWLWVSKSDPKLQECEPSLNAHLWTNAHLSSFLFLFFFLSPNAVHHIISVFTSMGCATLKGQVCCLFIWHVSDNRDAPPPGMLPPLIEHIYQWQIPEGTWEELSSRGEALHQPLYRKGPPSSISPKLIRKRILFCIICADSHSEYRPWFSVINLHSLNYYMVFSFFAPRRSLLNL